MNIEGQVLFEIALTLITILVHPTLLRVGGRRVGPEAFVDFAIASFLSYDFKNLIVNIIIINNMARWTGFPILFGRKETAQRSSYRLSPLAIRAPAPPYRRILS